MFNFPMMAGALGAAGSMLPRQPQPQGGGMIGGGFGSPLLGGNMLGMLQQMKQIPTGGNPRMPIGATPGNVVPGGFGGGGFTPSPFLQRPLPNRGVAPSGQPQRPVRGRVGGR